MIRYRLGAWGPPPATHQAARCAGLHLLNPGVPGVLLLRRNHPPGVLLLDHVPDGDGGPVRRLAELDAQPRPGKVGGTRCGGAVTGFTRFTGLFPVTSQSVI